MNKEEFIGKLQMVYVGDRNAIDEIVEYNQKLKNEVVYSKVEIDRLNNIIEVVYSKVEIDRLNNIIDELEKWLIKHIDEYRDMEQDAMFEFGLVLDKLKTLKENNKDAC